MNVTKAVAWPLDAHDQEANPTEQAVATFETATDIPPLPIGFGATLVRLYAVIRIVPIRI